MHTFYVYAWYFKSTGHIFHIGKGTGNRYLDTVHSRNSYFKNIIEKYPDDVAVKKLAENITNEDACALERKLIAKYKAAGECETNFHEGGCGGNTGNYHSQERHDKLSAAASKRVGKLNSNYGNHWSDEQRAAQSEKIKKAWAEHPEQFKTEKFLANSGWKKGNIPWSTGKTYTIGPMTEQHYLHMMQADCKYYFTVYYNDLVLYSCLGFSKLRKFFKDNFNLSRTIVEQLRTNTWKPKFNKHLKLAGLKIETIENTGNTPIETLYKENLIRVLTEISEE